MTLNVQKVMILIHEKNKISQPPPLTLGRFAPSQRPTPLTNPGYTTVTGIAKGARAHAPIPPWLEKNK